jgi:hypothetical protein
MDAANSGLRTVSRSRVRAASKVVVGSTATVVCSAMTASNAGIADSMSILSPAAVVMV